MRRIVALLAVAALVVAGLVVQLGLGAGPPTRSPHPSGVAVGPLPGATGATGGTGSSAPSRSPSTGPVPSATSATPSPPASGPPADVPIVPVTAFRNPWATTSAAEVTRVAAGTSSRYGALELVEAEAPAIVAALRVEPSSAAAHLVLAADVGALGRDLSAHKDRLAFVRADEVGPNVRALAWGDRALFGVDRVRVAGDWPLTARLPQNPGGGTPFDPATTWTLVAGGDILLDRGVAKAVKVQGKGVDFPFAGGTVEITGHCKDCSPLGWDLPYTKRTGNAGAMRHLLTTADLAVANFENPAPDAFRYHTQGTTFSADPALIAGLAHAGIDAVSIANNHIGDAGRLGVIQTRRNLAKDGIAAAGAGANAAEAHTPALLHAAGSTIALLGYDSIAKGYTAGASKPGSARLSAAALKADIAAARRAGAKVVIVYPHWGTEYDATPFGAQRTLAKAAIDAGADMVIGNHAHWAGAMEVYKGKPIWYALGNFVFDQTWSEPTSEGLTLELTFRGAQLVQIAMHPHLILDGAQPNFLDPAGDGRVVMGQVFAASKGLLPW
ncbi:MAG TPA: CapA family protein [Candidatus Limnocylindrales bacterium]|nr:CapA family protein [Candidatus Limnocylindrales bacterium]